MRERDRRSRAPSRSDGGRRLFHGWWMVAVLSATETVSFGILVYSFTVFIEPMRADLGWSVATLTGAYSVGLLVAGLAGVPLGRWLDEHGARLPMSLGSLLAAIMLALWATTHAVWAFYLVWVGIGLAMAAVLYEPAFAVLATWFEQDRGKALTVLTFFGGFASVIFIPLSGYLVDTYGWRTALLLLAAIQLTTLPLHALVLRRRPQDLGLVRDGRGGGEAQAAATAAEVRKTGTPRGAAEMGPVGGVSAAEAFRLPGYRRLLIAFSLSTFVVTAVSVHLVPMLMSMGSAATAAAGVGGLIGLVALPGRLVLTPLGDVWPRRLIAAGIFLTQTVGLAALLPGLGSGPLLWSFVLLYGAGFGAITPARAALLAEYYGPLEFGRINARMALVNSLARAIAPVSTGALVTVLNGNYTLLLLLLALTLAAATLAVARAGPPRKTAVGAGAAT